MPLGKYDRHWGFGSFLPSIFRKSMILKMVYLILLDQIFLQSFPEER